MRGRHLVCKCVTWQGGREEEQMCGLALPVHLPMSKENIAPKYEI